METQSAFFDLQPVAPACRQWERTPDIARADNNFATEETGLSRANPDIDTSSPAPHWRVACGT